MKAPPQPLLNVSVSPSAPTLLLRQHVWVSISTDLHLDATRDFRDLGCHVNIINNLQTLDKETRAFGLSKDYQVLPLSPLLSL